jgi:hypothetical protein
MKEKAGEGGEELEDPTGEQRKQSKEKAEEMAEERLSGKSKAEDAATTSGSSAGL